ncbi:MAG: hypothetical protein ABW173_10855 [Sphingomonas sp.]
MQRYYFHTADGGRDHDRDGADLAGPDAARLEAIRYAGSVLTHEPGQLREGFDFRVDVTDTGGALLFSIVAFVVDARNLR